MNYGIIASAAERSLYAPPPAPYAAYGVTFDETGYASNGLCINSQVVTDSPLLTVCMWVKVNNASTGPLLMALDGWDSYIQLGGFFSTDIVVYVANSSNASYQQFGSEDGVFTTGAWHHLFISVDCNHASGARLFNLLIDGTSSIHSDSTNSSGSAFSIGLNGTNFGIQADSANLGATSAIIEYADVWVSVGGYLDPATYLSKFISGGKPVDLGANGEIPTGSSPTYFFTGNASNFPTNKGTGSTASVVGSIANSSTHP